MSETVQTKRCPHCAEEILDEAKKCKHCGSAVATHTEIKPRPSALKVILWAVGLVMLAGATAAAWYFPLFVLAGWLAWKKVAPGRNRKIAIAALVLAFFVAAGIDDHLNGPPVVAITSPESGASVSASSTVVRGTVSRAGVPVRVNGVDAAVDGKTFTATVPLPDPENTVTVFAGEVAGDADRIGRASVLIRRSFTPEEWAARERAIEDERQRVAAEQEAQEAAAKAAENAWQASRAGRYCADNPDWSRDECRGVADRKIWVGMTYDMLVASYGSRPDSVNPSNYGNGTRYQYCWSSMTPSCFYDDNADGRIDAYN